MQNNRLPSPESGSSSRWHLPARMLLIAVIIGAILGTLHFVSGRSRSIGQLLQPAETPPLKGDLLYRLGLYLSHHSTAAPDALGLEADSLIQGAIAYYEKLAVGREPANTSAKLRLGIIYSRQGYPKKGHQQLQTLVTMDSDRAEYYFAVGDVYRSEALSNRRLRSIAEELKGHDFWFDRLVRYDCYRRLGEDASAERMQSQISRGRAHFFTVISVIGAVYAALIVAGIALLLRLAFKKLFRRSEARSNRRRWQNRWAAIDALEVGAAIFVFMILAGPLAQFAVENLQLRSNAPWAVPLVCIASYIVVVAPAIGLIVWKIRSAGDGVWKQIGLDGGPTGGSIFYAVGGYAVFAVVIAIGALILGAGRQYPVPMGAQSPAQLLLEAGSPLEFAGFFALICIIAPFVEEFVFRGFIYAGFRNSFNMSSAILLSAAIFAFAHLRFGLAGMASIAGIAVLLAYVYEQKRSLWASILIHSLHNLLAFSIILAITL